MRKGMIHLLISHFAEAFQQLQVQVDLKTIEDLSVMVHKAMTYPARNYHNLAHVFNFMKASAPVQVLAGLFHDLVYFQVDKGFLPEIWDTIYPYLEGRGESLFIAKRVEEDNKPFWLTLETFDLECGGLLSPISGLNEFLSALVMNCKLSGIISDKDLLKTTLCIEATIPFRSNEQSGDGHFDQLAARLPNICRRWDISMSEDEITAAIQDAVYFANLDVDNFAETDPAEFLEGTWKLLPEMNAALRSREVYSIREYRQALQNMEVFLSTLNPDNVFHSFRGFPADETMQQMVKRARRNILVAREYLRVKLLAQAILEALADATGGDAPLSLFMGDLPQEGETAQRLEDYLPEITAPEWLDPQTTVYILLNVGRLSELSFDLKTAPLSLYIYQCLEPAEMEKSISLAREMFSGQVTADQFLEHLNPTMVQDIAWASANMVLTRHEKLLQYAGNHVHRL